MCAQQDWIERRIENARRLKDATVTDAVASLVTHLLKGKASETSLTARELSDTAKALIANMVTRTANEAKSNDANRQH